MFRCRRNFLKMGTFKFRKIHFRYNNSSPLGDLTPANKSSS